MAGDPKNTRAGDPVNNRAGDWPETKRSDQQQVLSDDWTVFITQKRGEWVEMYAAGNDAALPSLERFLGDAIAARSLEARST